MAHIDKSALMFVAEQVRSIMRTIADFASDQRLSDDFEDSPGYMADVVDALFSAADELSDAAGRLQDAVQEYEDDLFNEGL